MIIAINNGGFLLLFFFVLICFTALSSSSLDSSFPPYPPPSSPEESTIQSTVKIITAIGTTGASTFVVAGAFFLCFTCFRLQRREVIVSGGGQSNQTRSLTSKKVEAGSRSEVKMFDGDIKELIVDEEGLDVLYWKKLKNINGSIHDKPTVRLSYGNGNWNSPAVQHVRSSSSHGQLLTDQRSEGRSSGFGFHFPANSGGGVVGSSASYGQILPDQRSEGQNSGFAFQFASNYGGRVGGSLSSTAILTTPDSSSMAVAHSRSSSSYGQMLPGQHFDGQSSGFPLQFAANSGGGVGGSPSSTAILTASALSSTAVSSIPTPAPAEPPPPPKKIAPIPPPPPPAPLKKAPLAPPPPPPKPGSDKKPSAPKPPSRGSKTPEAVDKEGGKDQVMLKPLHWEKLNVNPEHSMVWDKIERGSFQYTDDKMEALFGFVPGNRKSAMDENPNSKASDPSAKIFILDPRKSRNTAIVLKSLGIPRSELIDSLLEGKGLSIETLEKLARTAPTREEESEILAFDGEDPAKLADAESFLYTLLKAVPLAFTRANAMLFRLNYGSEIESVKESLQMMEPACNEIRSPGMFLKLLEAILKAGNRLNAGTARGDAKAFNLTTLLKLSDFKSSDGKTTLLSFVVHEVVRNEGRKIVSTRKKENDTDSAPKRDDKVDEEEKERELLQLGLPVVSGLSSEFSNVKKAASIDYDALKSALASLKNRVDETKQLVSKCKSSGGGGGFLKEMDDFLESAEMEFKALQDEHTRVMDLVKKTTQYYQAGASNDKNPLQLFIIVKDFLGMVDETCAQIARTVKPKKPAAAAAAATSAPSSTQQELLRTRVIFPGLKEHFLLANKSNISSSDSEDDF